MEFMFEQIKYGTKSFQIGQYQNKSIENLKEINSKDTFNRLSITYKYK